MLDISKYKFLLFDACFTVHSRMFLLHGDWKRYGRMELPEPGRNLQLFHRFLTDTLGRKSKEHCLAPSRLLVYKNH